MVRREKPVLNLHLLRVHLVLQTNPFRISQTTQRSALATGEFLRRGWLGFASRWLARSVPVHGIVYSVRKKQIV